MKPFRHLAAGLLLLASTGSLIAAPVDINRADAETLAASISGVGLSKASAIVEYRETYGPFGSVDDLALVKGIGSRTVDKNRDNLTAGGK